MMKWKTTFVEREECVTLFIELSICFHFWLCISPLHYIKCCNAPQINFISIFLFSLQLNVIEVYFKLTDCTLFRHVFILNGESMFYIEFSHGKHLRRCVCIKKWYTVCIARGSPHICPIIGTVISEWMTSLSLCWAYHFTTMEHTWRKPLKKPPGVPDFVFTFNRHSYPECL